MTAKIILNPYAGRWKGLQKRGEVESALKTLGVEFELVLTEAPNHGVELAVQAVKDGFSPIISAGGDGSVSEVMNGMVKASQKLNIEPIPLGMLPLGTANDLMVNLGLPTDIPGAARVIAQGYTQRIDLGEVTAWDTSKSASKVRYFDNNSAIGLEPSITLIQQRISFLRGTIRYLVAAILGVAKNPQWSMHLEWDGGNYDGPATLV